MENMRFKNKDQKFALWGKRLVWGTETMSADAAVESVIAAEKVKDSPELDVETLAAAAKAKVGDAEKAKVDQAKGKFEAFVRAVRQRTNTLAVLNGINGHSNNVDLKAWIGKIEPLKAGRDLLVAQFGAEDEAVTAIDVKDKEIKDMEGKSEEKKAYYETLLQEKKPEAMPDQEEPSEEAKKTHAAALLAYIADLSVIGHKGYEYLDVNDVKGVSQQYEAAIGQAQEELSGLQAVLDDEQKNSLKNLDFAKTNLAAAKEASHKAGAQECFNAAMAEQEARSIWNKVGEPDSLEESLSIIYTNAKAAFEEGQRLFKSSKGSGKWQESTDSFKKASSLWQEIINEQNTANTVEEDEEKEEEGVLREAKAKAEKAKKRVTEYFRAISPVKLRDYAGTKGTEKWMAAENFMNTESATKEDYEAAASNYKEAENLYKAAVEECEKGKEGMQKALQGALKGIQSEASNLEWTRKGGWKKIITEAVNRYVKTNPNLEGVLRYFVYQGSFYYEYKTEGNDQKKEAWYNVVVSSQGGSWQVDIQDAKDRGALHKMGETSVRAELDVADNKSDAVLQAVKDKIGMKDSEGNMVGAVFSDAFKKHSQEKVVKDFVMDTVRRMSADEWNAVRGKKLVHQGFEIEFDDDDYDDRDIDVDTV